jgi:hypothetical protein
MRALTIAALALALTACTATSGPEWIRCTATNPADGRCSAWVIGPPNFDKKGTP